MKSLYDLMGDADSRPVALFGDVCTNVNEPVAMTSKYWDILHLSYAETHAKFGTADAHEVSEFDGVWKNALSYCNDAELSASGQKHILAVPHFPTHSARRP